MNHQICLKFPNNSPVARCFPFILPKKKPSNFSIMIACCFIEQSLREAEVTRSEFVKQQEYAQQQQLQFVSEAVSMEVT